MDGNKNSLAKFEAGASVYSSWYTDLFSKEHFSNKKNELARVYAEGDFQKFGDWLNKTQRRFQSLFDRLSDETKRAYQSSAKHFGGYIGIKHAKVSEIVARLISLSYIEACTLIEEYIRWMEEEQELSPNTINRHVAALRFFVDAARRVGWVEYKLDVKGVKTQKVKDVDAFSEKEFRRILRVINRATGKTAARNKLMIYMLAFMGLRISSALSLDFENIDFENHRFKVRWKAEGKNYKWRPVGTFVFKALKEWLEDRGDHPGPIFTNFDPGKKGSGRLTLRSAERIVAEIGAEAGTRKKLHTHAFRHFYADDNLKATNQNTRDVSGGLGHKNIKTIEEYVTKSKGEKRTRKLVEQMEKRWVEETLEESHEDDLEDHEDDNEDNDIEEVEEEIDGVVSAQEAIDNRIEYERISSGMSNVDIALGGGIVVGSLLLFGGNPGIGKSTLVRQMCARTCYANPKMRVLYASGEEPVPQIAEALNRIGAVHKNFRLTSERSINTICRYAERLKVGLLVVDSVNAVAKDGNHKEPGGVTQLKAVARYLMEWTKGIASDEDDEIKDGSGISVIIICHVDKKGKVAGPKMLEHFVDALFMFTGSEHTKPRTLSSSKNRFGDTTKIAMFKMTKKGVIEQECRQNDDDDEDDDDGPINTFGEDEDIEDGELEDEED